MNAAPVTHLNGKKIAFPSVKSFAELFPKVSAARGESPTLLSLKAWDGRSRFRLTGWMTVEDVPSGERRSFHVQASPELLEYVRGDVLHVSNDAMYFSVMVYEDGTALVIAQHGQIIGSHYLALIDAATVPASA